MNGEAAQEMLRKYLKSQGNLRSTPARMAILDAIVQTQGHFDAEGLYYRLMSSGKRISRATVYNTLDLFRNAAWFQSTASPRTHRATKKRSAAHIITTSSAFNAAIFWNS